MRLLPTSVRARLTLWYTVVLAVPLIAFAVASYLIFSRTLVSRTDAFIGDALSAFASEAANERARSTTLAGALRTTAAEVRFTDLGIVVVDGAGAVMATSARVQASGDADAVTAELAERGVARPWAATLRRPSGGVRVLARPLPLDGTQLGLAGVYPLLEVETTLERIRGWFLIVIPLLIASAATGGSFLARRSFRPVSAMAARAAEIGAATLHERLPVVADDELGGLARVLNDLLDRLERSFAQQRRFMADASHELRTPTAILRTEADVTLSRPERSEAEYRASMAVVQDSARRLGRIVDDLFLLARADAGHLVLQPGPLYLEDLVRDTVRAVHPIAEARGVRVDLGALVEAPCHGDGDLLGRVLLNLLDNAIKHSAEGGVIAVAMTPRDGGRACNITVVDGGPGVPPDARERIFERFYRADSARARAENTVTSGAGLGLAIGRRIAEMHGGSLVLVDSRPGRTEFRLTLPVGGEGAEAG